MGKGFALVVVLVFLTAFFLTLPLPVKAQSKTIVVPDDYLTIAEAIKKAGDGDTIFIRDGNYDGPINQTLVIDKTISIIGEDAAKTVITFYPAWVTYILFTADLSYYANSLEINANNVKISDLTINTLLLGDHPKHNRNQDICINGDNSEISRNLLSTDVVITGSYNRFFENNSTKKLTLSGYLDDGNVEWCTYNRVYENNIVNSSIESSSGSYNTIYSNTVSIGGIEVGGMSEYVLVYGNTIINGPASVSNGLSGNGIGVSSTKNTVACNTIINCSNGVSLYRGNNNTVVGNLIMNCTEAGLRRVEGTNCEIYANYVTNCFVGVTAGTNYGSGNNFLYDNNFVNNVQQSYLDATTSDWWDDGKQGNYWSDYSGKDLNGDGIGDTPYELAGKGNGSDRYPLMKPFDVLTESVPLSDWAVNLPKVTIEIPATPETTPTSASPNEPFPTVPVATVSVASGVAMAVIGLLVFYSKRHREAART